MQHKIMLENAVICVKLLCNLRQVTMCFASSCAVKAVILRAEMTEIANPKDKNEGIETIKWLHTHVEGSFPFLFGRRKKC